MLVLKCTERSKTMCEVEYISSQAYSMAWDGIQF